MTMSPVLDLINHMQSFIVSLYLVDERRQILHSQQIRLLAA